jgi:hypothetical protein
LKINEWQINVVPDETDLEEDAVQPFEGGFQVSFYGKNFRYDRFGLDLES